MGFMQTESVKNTSGLKMILLWEKKTISAPITYCAFFQNILFLPLISRISTFVPLSNILAN